MVHTPFHGLTQAGRQPSMRFQQLNQAFQSDPRRILGQALMGQGASTAPVRTPLQGLGRLSSALIGAYLQRRANDTQVERETDYRTRLDSALANSNVEAFPAIAGIAPEFPELALPALLSAEATRAGRTPPAPVQMVNPKTRDVTSAVPGSPEQSNLFASGYQTGSLPNPDTGFMFTEDGQQVVRPGGSAARTLRDSFVKSVKKEEAKLFESDVAFKNAQDFVANPSGGSDTALIYNFFTTLDPGGKVTDGEAQMSQTAQSYSDQFTTQVFKAFRGGVLGDDARKEILSVMRGLVNQRRTALQTSVNDATPYITELGFTPQNTFSYYNLIFNPTDQVASVSNGSENKTEIVPGQTIVTPGGSSADPAIANASDADLLGGLF